MGFKKTNAFFLIQNGVMTGSNTLTSAAQNLQNFDNVGLEVTWTGTPTGTISILGSVSAALPNAATTSYYALTFTNPILIQPSGSASGYLINLNQFPYPFMKFQYVNASSTGTLNVYLYAKDVN